MSYDPLHLTSLEEDFRRIGLLAEAKPPGLDKEEPHPGVKHDDEDDEKGNGPGDKKEDQLDSRVAKTEAAIKIRRIKRARGKVKAKRKSYFKSHKAKLLRGQKKYRHTSAGKRQLGRHKKVMMRLGHPAGKGKRVYTSGIDRVASMVEDINDILGALESKDFSEAVKSFANIAIIAERLSGFFGWYGEETKDSSMVEMAGSFNELAEEAAAAAEELDKARQNRDTLRAIDQTAVAEDFRAQMEMLIDGLELYESLFEDEEHDGAHDEHGDKENDMDVHSAAGTGDEHEEDDEHEPEDHDDEHEPEHEDED